MVNKKTVLVTGAAGFIGYYMSKKLLDNNCIVIGYDNLNTYYDVSLKHARLDKLKHENFIFIKGDLAKKDELEAVFSKYNPEVVINLAAQAGVRYSIENPDAYISSNVVGFLNVLECCRHYSVSHLIYASSSSVYGSNKKVPFSINDRVDQPVSLYAATKKSNELMAYTYSHLYGIPATGLRFFTVYGPYGRPDMAYFSFTKAILSKQPIKIFNNGDMYRDFTYIDDIILGIEKLIDYPPTEDDNGARYKIYNIGNNKPEKLMDFINTLESLLGQEALKEYFPMQDGDVYQTYADVSNLIREVGFKPNTPIKEGLKQFIKWYKSYYN